MKKFFLICLMMLFSVNVYAQVTYADDEQAEFGTDDDVSFEWDTTQTPDAFVWTVGTASRNLIICEEGDQGTDFGHAVSTNPQLIIHSSDATDTSDYVGFHHDQTDFNIEVGNGNLVVNYSDGNGAFWKTNYIDASEMYLHNGASIANTEGFFEIYINATTEYAYFSSWIDSWDGNSDVVVEVLATLNAAEGVGDDIELECYCSFAQNGEVFDTHAQNRGISHDVAALNADATRHVTYFVFDHDSGTDPISDGDVFMCWITLDAQTNINEINIHGAKVYYRTAHPNNGYTGSFPSED